MGGPSHIGQIITSSWNFGISDQEKEKEIIAQTSFGKLSSTSLGHLISIGRPMMAYKRYETGRPKGDQKARKEYVLDSIASTRIHIKLSDTWKIYLQRFDQLWSSTVYIYIYIYVCIYIYIYILLSNVNVYLYKFYIATPI